MKKRRQFSPEYKTRLVLELISGQRSAAEFEAQRRAEQFKNSTP